MRRSILFTVMMIAATALAGCFSADRDIPRAQLVPEDADLAYRLGSGDRVRVIVFGQDSLSNLYNVDEHGRIFMPLVGDVPLGGLTTDQSASLIEARLKNGYLRDPDVAVEVQTFRPFYIIGQVGQPGQYPFVAGMTVQNAVAISGGLTERAQRRYAILTRRYGEEILKYRVAFDTVLFPGDTVEVLERWF